MSRRLLLTSLLILTVGVVLFFYTKTAWVRQAETPPQPLVVIDPGKRANLRRTDEYRDAGRSITLESNIENVEALVQGPKFNQVLDSTGVWSRNGYVPANHKDLVKAESLTIIFDDLSTLSRGAYEGALSSSGGKQDVLVLVTAPTSTTILVTAYINIPALKKDPVRLQTDLLHSIFLNIFAFVNSSDSDRTLKETTEANVKFMDSLPQEVKNGSLIQLKIQ